MYFYTYRISQQYWAQEKVTRATQHHQPIELNPSPVLYFPPTKLVTSALHNITLVDEQLYAFNQSYFDGDLNKSGTPKRLFEERSELLYLTIQLLSDINAAELSIIDGRRPEPFWLLNRMHAMSEAFEKDVVASAMRSVRSG